MFSSPPPISLKELSSHILRLSDFYIANPAAETPWREEWCLLAYRYYFLPLNFIRVQKVIERGLQRNFFEGLDHFIDWGAGPGTASFALASNESLAKQIQSQLLFDISENAINSFSDYQMRLLKNFKTCTKLELQRLSEKKRTCLVFSYSLTELDDLPAGWKDFEALMIREPSTGEDGRRLMAWREKITAAGFSLWAPCTHELSCPLLTHSKNDWCHDRTAVHLPDWFSELENHLPMRNRIVTVSYLLARKTKPQKLSADTARVVGDSLGEKGKTRQLICRGTAREYLSWLHKNGEPQVIPRGELIEVAANAEVKANEIRMSSHVKVL